MLSYIQLVSGVLLAPQCVVWQQSGSSNFRGYPPTTRVRSTENNPIASVRRSAGKHPLQHHSEVMHLLPTRALSAKAGVNAIPNLRAMRPLLSKINHDAITFTSQLLGTAKRKKLHPLLGEFGLCPGYCRTSRVLSLEDRGWVRQPPRQTSPPHPGIHFVALRSPVNISSS